jgi:hypothetical protein
VEPPNLVKVVAAFVAGVVIALGSALIYTRVSEMIHPEPVALAQTTSEASQPATIQLPDTPADSNGQATGAEKQERTTLPVERPKKTTPMNTTPRLIIRPHLVASAPRKQQPWIPMAQVAHNKVPANEPVTYVAQQVDAAPVETAAPIDAPAQAPDPDPSPQPHVITLQAGTALPIRLSETLSSDHNYTGDTFRGTLEAPIIVDGFIIADRGSKVLGRVVSAEKAGRMEGAADLNLTLSEINTTDGQRIRVETSSFDRKGLSSTGDDAAKIAGGAALGAIIGAVAGGGKGAAIGAGIGGAAGTGVVFATRGKAATLPVETRITFTLAAPLTLMEKLN